MRWLLTATDGTNHQMHGDTSALLLVPQLLLPLPSGVHMDHSFTCW
jgi:hypothetical protein